MDARHQERNGQTETPPRHGLFDAAAVAHQDGVRGRHVEQWPTAPPLRRCHAAPGRVDPGDGVSTTGRTDSIRPTKPGRGLISVTVTSSRRVRRLAAATPV